MTAAVPMTDAGTAAASADARAVLRVVEVNYSFRKRRSKPRTLLQDISLTIGRGQSAAIMGPSGSGKTSLLSICMGLLKPDAGRVVVGETDIVPLSRRQLALVRSSHLGVVFQSGELLPELSPLENVALPALLRAADRGAAYERADPLLYHMGLRLDGTPTDRLSGGERQRVAVARALINNPAVLLADEPTGSLDVDSRDQVADYLFALPQRESCGMLVVTHDPAIAGRADVLYRLSGGHLAVP